MIDLSEKLTQVKTKIIATLGPASQEVALLTRLVEAGVDLFRLNMAHGSRDWHDQIHDRIQQVSRELDRPVGILADLAGPKIRLGPLEAVSRYCAVGQTLRFVTDPEDVTGSDDLTSTYSKLVHELNVGDSVLLADGTVVLSVEHKAETAVTCTVIQPGEISSGSGINLPNVELSTAALTEKDRADLEWLATRDVDYIGLSFVRRADDVRLLRQDLNRLQCSACIVAKIEKPQAVDALDEIIQEADAIMVARGDLGVEIDVARIAFVQKEIIRKCHRAGVPVITATQMLESMRNRRIPTRAEATDVANAVLDGTDAVMLSAETAVGEYPIESVAMMSRISRQTEQLLQLPVYQNQIHRHPESSHLTGALVQAGSQAADQLGAKLMIVASNTGKTALLLSKLRRFTPTVAVSNDITVVRKMCLFWGVTPLHTARSDSNQELLDHCVTWARNQKLLDTGDRVVMLGGSVSSTADYNMLIVHEVT